MWMPSSPGAKALRNGLCELADSFTTLFGPGPHGLAGGASFVCSSKSPSNPVRSSSSFVSATGSSPPAVMAGAGSSVETGEIGASCTPRLSHSIAGSFVSVWPSESSTTRSIAPDQPAENGLPEKSVVLPGMPTLPDRVRLFRSRVSCRLCHWFGFNGPRLSMVSPLRSETDSDEMSSSTAGDAGMAPIQNR